MLESRWGDDQDSKASRLQRSTTGTDEFTSIQIRNTDRYDQICACLRAALGNADLADQGLSAWIIMMDTLSEEEIMPLVDPTFALLVQHWNSFSSKMQFEAHDMVSRLLKSHQQMIREIVHTLPSLASIPLMSKFEGELSKNKSRMDIRHYFLAFGDRCQSENATVILRALDELAVYLQEHQDWLHEQAGNAQPDAVVGQLMRAVLDTSVLFSDTNSEISILCAKCLGLIGCLDYTRIEAVKERRDILVLSNFENEDELQDFIIFFLREVLVKAFLSATNSRSQGFLAYAMQEILAIGGFQASIGGRPRDAQYDATHRRWHSLPESMRTTLTPFLDSKYFVTAGVAQPPCKYPLFTPGFAHKQWLRTFTFDLLKKNVGTGDVVSLFAVLSRIIRAQDIAISGFLLPFAVLNIITRSSSDDEKGDIAREILVVLKTPLTEQSSARDDLILCSQVGAFLRNFKERDMLITTDRFSRA